MTVARGGKRGKTSGRGGKGQTARAGNKRRPEWRDIIKRLPKLRGRGVNSNKTVMTNSQRPFIVNLGHLENNFKAGDAVSPAILVEKGIVKTWSGKVMRVKILGDGEITKALKITGCSVSDTAKAAITKAGGTIEVINPEGGRTQEVKVRTSNPADDVKAKPAAKKEDKKEAKVKAPKVVKEKKAEKPAADAKKK